MCRPGHFFPEKLLDSQLDILEPPAPDERVQTVLAEGDDPVQTAAKIIATLWPDGDPALLSPGGTPPVPRRMSGRWQKPPSYRPLIRPSPGGTPPVPPDARLIAKTAIVSGTRSALLRP
jgi:hypothetical protein